MILLLLRLQAAVVSALSALCEEYYQADTGQADSDMQGWLNVILLLHLLYCMSEFHSNLCLVWCVFVCVCVSAEALVSQYIEGLKSPQMLARCGSALALGCLPTFMIHGKVMQVRLENVLAV